MNAQERARRGGAGTTFRATVIAVVLAVIAVARSAGAGSAHRAFPAEQLAGPPAPSASLSRLVLSFEPNRGQAPSDVRYLAHGPGYTLLLTDTGPVFVLSRAVPAPTPLQTGLPPRPHVEHAVVGMRLLGIRHARLVATRRLPGIVNYLIGNNPRHWHTRIPTYARIEYRDVYPGIDLAFYGARGEVEYDWVVHPHANSERIATAFEGARRVRLDRRGNLVLQTPVGTLQQQVPHIYQQKPDGRAAVAGGYRLRAGGRVGFRLHAYDTRRTLVIDPQIGYSTFFGGPASDLFPQSIAVDGDGNAYIAGTVEGTIPVSNPTFQAAQASPSASDAFVAKIDPTGSFFFYSTYLGGTDYDNVGGIAVDASGYAYVCGGTTSTDFPMLPNGMIQPGSAAAYVVRVATAGYSLSYAYATVSQYGAHCAAVAVDPVGRAYFAATFQLPAGSVAKSFASVTELDLSGKFVRGFNTLSKSKPDNGPTTATGIALGPQGDIVFAGYTQDAYLPVKNPLQVNLAGGRDAFVFKLDDQWNVDWATYLGGNLDDSAVGVGVDANDNVFLAGYTRSKDFPTANALQPNLAGTIDAFVTELPSDGQSAVYSTYFGGTESTFEQLGGMAVDLYGNVYLTGTTDARDFPIVTTNEVMPGPSQRDAYISEIGFGGRPLVYSTFFGGSDNDGGNAIAVDPQGNTYVFGSTSSLDLPTSNGVLQPNLLGQTDAFVLKLVPSPPTPTATPTSIPTATPTPTATQTPVPHPGKPQLFLKPTRVRAGKQLALTVLTEPDADVQAAVVIKVKKSVLYKTTRSGTADGRGEIVFKLKITFQPAKATTAHITVTVHTAGGSASASVTFTILPHQ